VIFYHDAAPEKAAAEESLLKAGKEFSSPIVTAIEPLTKFFEAEEYHQDYFRNNPRAPYCMFVIKTEAGKTQPRRTLTVPEIDGAGSRLFASHVPVE